MSSISRFGLFVMASLNYFKFSKLSTPWSHSLQASQLLRRSLAAGCNICTFNIVASDGGGAWRP